MSTVVGWLGLLMIAVAALAGILWSTDDLLINFHWTVPLIMAVFGLILVLVDEFRNG
jgi:hypothetical protein